MSLSPSLPGYFPVVRCLTVAHNYGKSGINDNLPGIVAEHIRDIEDIMRK